MSTQFRAPITLDELKTKSVRELKDILSAEGYDPKQVVGIEKNELIDRIWMLKQNPTPEDDEPLPLASNCWQQFILRAILLSGIYCFAASYIVGWYTNIASLFMIVFLIFARNVIIRRRKAARLRSRKK